MPFEPGLAIVNRSRATTLADHVEVATSFWARARGLIGRESLPDGFALIIRPCGAIHMLMVRVPLDVLHIDKRNRVVKILSIKPWRLGPVVPQSRWVIELPVGTALRTATRVGDVVDVIPAAATIATQTAPGHIPPRDATRRVP
jgi:uncharacterized membrane protein (UPF0127 family)